MKKGIKRCIAFFLALFVAFGTLGLENVVYAAGKNIQGNGTGGIWIDINSYPFNTYNYQGIAYTNQGCTWFVASRAAQLTNRWVGIYGAKNWWNNHRNDFGYGSSASVPQAPAIMCWGGSANNSWGHVAILEKIEGNTAYISEGGWWGGNNANGYTKISTTNLGNLTYKTDGWRGVYPFLGYIYLGPAQVTIPSAPGSVSVSSTDIGLGDALTTSWTGVANASNYTVDLQCTTNSAFNQSKTVGGTTTSFVISNPGIYRVAVKANNSSGSSGATTSGNCVAHSNCVVTYKDWDGKVIETRTVKYGANSNAPTAPSREGYTFQGWSSDGKNIKADTTITATYKINTYSVKFVDYNGDTIGNIQKVEYGKEAVPPTEIPAKDGYIFSHWDTDEYSCVKKQLTVQAVYVWENMNLPIVTQITSAKRNDEATGYNIGIKMSSFPKDFTKGKIVTALKTKDGKMVASETTSISLPASGEFTDTIFVMYSGLASCVEVSIVGVVDDDTTGTPKSKSVTKAVDVGNKWSDWSGNPAPDGDDIIAESRKEYRYKDKKVITATSQPATPSGYTYSDCQATGGYTDYGPWSGWSSGAVGASATRQVEARTGYRFYAFICPNCGTHDPLSGACSNCGTNVYWSERYEGYSGYGYSGGYVPAWNGCKVKGRIWLDGNWWYFEYDGTNNGWTGTGQPKITQYHYRDRQPYYNYSYWQTAFSQWSEKEVSSSSTRQVETRTAYRFKTNSTEVPCYNYKRYKYQNLNNGRYIYTYTSVYADSMEYPGEWEYNKAFAKLKKVATVDEDIDLYNGTGDQSWYQADINDEGELTTFETKQTLEDTLGTKRKVTGKATGAEGKRATLLVYKGTNADPTASQIEYCGQTTISEDGTYSFEYIPKEEPSTKTGDFIVTLGIEGATNYIEIGRIEAPKPTYSVEFVDYDGNKIGETQTIKEGDNAVAPEAPQREGYDFVGWDTGLTNVHDNLIVTAEYKKKECTVVFVNWDETGVAVKKFEYGDELALDTLPSCDGKKFDHWCDEKGEEAKTVKGDMVVTASYKDTKYTVVFLDWDGNEISREEVSYLGEAKTPTVSDSPSEGELQNHKSQNQVFLNWNSFGQERCVTSDMMISPVEQYTKTADKPSISVEQTGEKARVTIQGNGSYDSISYYVLYADDESPIAETKTYSEAFEVSKNAEVYAFATGNQMNDSELVCKNITFNGSSVNVCKEHSLKHIGAKKATCTEKGNIEYYVCEKCGKYFADKNATKELNKESVSVKATGHKNTVIKNKKAPTVNAKGYTGDTYCKDCGTKISKGKAIAATVKNKSVIQPVTNKKKEDAATYLVTSTSKKTVTYQQSKSISKKVVIPDSVKDANGKSYKVTAIANGAIKNNKNVTSVVIGKNIQTIGKSAFEGNKKLKKITLNGNNVRTIGKNAFKNIKSKCNITIQVKNNSQYKKIVKLIKKSGAKKVKYNYKQIKK